jgi:hypothetical protein
MKKLIIAALAAAGLGGCIAVPAPYYGDGGYYSAAPAVAVGVYAPPVYYGHGHRRHHHRHHGRW